jgi:inosine-uridine nucleoside N-ribohydrolase
MHVREMRQLTVSELDKYIILDTQGGHEDIIGLITALKLAAQHNRVVIGITCVKGRRSLDSCIRDALIAQQIAGTKVPVFKGITILNLGCTKSLLLREEFPECVNMSKNFSDLDSFPLDEKLNQVVQKQSAASFISASIK